MFESSLTTLARDFDRNVKEHWLNSFVHTNAVRALSNPRQFGLAGLKFAKIRYILYISNIYIKKFTKFIRESGAKLVLGYFSKL